MLDGRNRKYYDHVLTLSTILCQVYAGYLYHHLWSETRQTGYSMGVTVRLESVLDFGQENGASEEETLERTTRRKHPEEIPKTFKVGFVSIYLSSNSLAKTLLTKCR